MFAPLLPAAMLCISYTAAESKGGQGGQGVGAMTLLTSQATQGPPSKVRGEAILLLHLKM